jgi:hypothetical protein
MPFSLNNKILEGRKITLRMIYKDRTSLDKVEKGFVEFSTACRRFKGYDVIRDRGLKKSYTWWATRGATCIVLQQLAMRIL